jgi:hypothetical protein
MCGSIRRIYMDESSAKIMYDLTKLTNKPRQITSDFIETITLVMFREFINHLPNKEEYLDLVLNTWEEQILGQKEAELELLTAEHNTMFELVAGSVIANSENIKEFTKEVDAIKKIYRSNLISN